MERWSCRTCTIVHEWKGSHCAMCGTERRRESSRQSVPLIDLSNDNALRNGEPGGKKRKRPPESDGGSSAPLSPRAAGSDSEMIGGVVYLMSSSSSGGDSDDETEQPALEAAPEAAPMQPSLATAPEQDAIEVAAEAAPAQHSIDRTTTATTSGDEDTKMPAIDVPEDMSAQDAVPEDKSAQEFLASASSPATTPVMSCSPVDQNQKNVVIRGDGLCQITRSLSSAFDDENTAPEQHSIEAAAAQPSSGLPRRVSVEPDEGTPEESPSANARLLSDIESKVRLYLLVGDTLDPMPAKIDSSSRI